MDYWFDSLQRVDYRCSLTAGDIINTDSQPMLPKSTNGNTPRRPVLKSAPFGAHLEIAKGNLEEEKCLIRVPAVIKWIAVFF